MAAMYDANGNYLGEEVNKGDVANVASVINPLAAPLFADGNAENMSGGDIFLSTLMPLGHGGTMNAKKQAQKQQQAANNALASQNQMGMDSLRRSTQMTNSANAATQIGLNNAINASSTGANNAIGSLQQGQNSAFASLMQGANQGRADLQAASGQLEQNLAPLTGLQSYAGQAGAQTDTFDLLGQRNSRANALLDDPNSFTQDPGYQFRQQQGEQAINRANAARGGRASGRAMKELAQFNSGLASQEFGNAFNRASQADAADFAALANQAGRNDSAALTDKQRQMGLANVGFGAQSALARGNLGLNQASANMGLNAYNQAAANAMGTGQGIAGIQQGQGSLAASLYTGAAGQQAQNYNNQANRDTSITQTLIPEQTAPVEKAGGEEGARAAGQQNLVNVGGLLASLFSDERVKRNVKDASFDVDEFMAHIEPSSFDYIDKIFGDDATTGVIAQDVAKSPAGRSLISRDEKTGAMKLDTRKTVSMLLASVARLDKRLRAQEAQNFEIRLRLDAILEAVS